MLFSTYILYYHAIKYHLVDTYKSFTDHNSTGHHLVRLGQRKYTPKSIPSSPRLAIRKHYIGHGPTYNYHIHFKNDSLRTLNHT